MPLQCPTLHFLGIPHITIPFDINTLKFAVFRAVRLYMPLSLLWLLTRRYNKALWIFLWVSKRFELCHILFSWNTAAFLSCPWKEKGLLSVWLQAFVNIHFDLSVLVSDLYSNLFFSPVPCSYCVLCSVIRTSPHCVTVIAYNRIYIISALNVCLLSYFE